MATSHPTLFTAAVGRVLWMIAGPMLLLLLGFAIASQATGWLTMADLLFFLALGLMLFGRWLEFHAGHPQTATGEPATARHLYRYLIVAGTVGVIAWVIANVLGNHLLAFG